MDHCKPYLLAVILLSLNVGAHAAEGPPSTLLSDRPPPLQNTKRAQLALGLPLPLELGFEYRCEGALVFCTPSVRYFLSGGYFRFPLFSNADRVFRSAGVRMGVRRDLGAWLYASGALGYRYLGVKAGMETFKVEGENLASSASLGTHALAFQPALGAEWRLGGGLSLGFELGVQLVFASWGSFSLESAPTNENTLSVNGASAPLRKIAGQSLPTVTLLKLSLEL